MEGSAGDSAAAELGPGAADGRGPHDALPEQPHVHGVGALYQFGEVSEDLGGEGFGACIGS